MSALTLRNTTDYIAQFVVHKGDQVVARLPGIAPGASMTIPTDDTWSVTATTILDGNTCTTAPAIVSNAAGFVARVLQDSGSGAYDFELMVVTSSAPDELQFRTAAPGPVTFNVTQNGVFLQDVVVPDSTLTVTLRIDDDVYSFYAVIDGMTTDSVQTTNPNATVTAELDATDLEAGCFRLTVS